MLKPVLKYSQRFIMIVFLLSSLLYQWQPATASQTAELSSPPKAPQGLSGPGNSILLSGAAPSGLSNNSYVQVPFSSALNPSGGSITIEAWVKRTDANRCETLVGNDYLVSYWLGFCPKLRFYANGGSFVDSNGVVPANHWTHVAVTYDGSTTKMYINGVLDSTSTSLSGAITPANGTPLGIGFDIQTSFTSNYFEGEIQEVRIWNTVHTQAQIQGSMFQIFGKSQPNMLAEWPFGNDTKDYSGGGHDGIPELVASFPIDGAIPHDLLIPQVSLATTPALNGICDTSTKYANAVQVNAGDYATAYLMHTATDLWVCINDLTTPVGTHDNWAAVYLDVNHTRVDPDKLR